MPAIKYQLKDGTIIQGVTTILNNNLAWNKGNLMGWAYNQGKAGLPLRDQDALDIGTIAHKWVEADIKLKDFKIPDLSDEMKGKVENSFLAYLDINYKSKTNRYTPEWDDKQKMLIVKIT